MAIGPAPLHYDLKRYFIPYGWLRKYWEGPVLELPVLLPRATAIGILDVDDFGHGSFAATET